MSADIRALARAGRLTTDVRNASDLLNLGRQAGYAAAKDGRLPGAHRIGRRIVVSLPELCTALGLDYAALLGPDVAGDEARGDSP